MMVDWVWSDFPVCLSRVTYLRTPPRPPAPRERSCSSDTEPPSEDPLPGSGSNPESGAEPAGNTRKTSVNKTYKIKWNLSLGLCINNSLKNDFQAIHM